MAERPRWLPYRAREGILETHIEYDDDALNRFMSRALAWSDGADSADDKQTIRILDTFLGSRPDYVFLEEATKRALTGVPVRILLAQPFGDFARARARSLGPELSPAERTRVGLTNVLEVLHRAMGRRRKIERASTDTSLNDIVENIRVLGQRHLDLRFYNEFPSGPLYFARDLLLAGRYCAGRSAYLSPWTLIVNDTQFADDLYDQFSDEFEWIWTTASETIQDEASTVHDLPDVSWRSTVDVIEAVCRRFPRAVDTLAKRQRQRQALMMNDEFDVQDLLYSILRVLFEDVRREEYNSSWGGGNSRMDFFLKRESMVIEAKMTGIHRGAKVIGEELIVDIEKYRRNPWCKYIAALVYDPTRQIANPAALESDLSGDRDGFQVGVYVVQA